MSLLIDVLRKQEQTTEIPETEAPDAEDLAAIQQTPGDDNSSDDPVALQLDADIAHETTEAQTVDESKGFTGAPLDSELLELIPEPGAEDSPGKYDTMVANSSSVAKQEGPDPPQTRPTLAGNTESTTASPRGWPRGVWAITALCAVPVLVVSAYVLLQPETRVYEPVTTDAMNNEIPNDVRTPDGSLTETAISSSTAPPVQERQELSSTQSNPEVMPQPRDLAPATEPDEAANKAPAIQVTRVRTEDPVYAQLLLAYEAYMVGEDAAAETHYRAAAALDANNRNALLGLASIAQRNGRLTEARSRYRQLLALNPKDGVAVAGMLSLRDHDDTVVSESRLKSMLRDEPESAHLHFALGLQYVSQGRWPDAQRAFFEAVRHTPGHADYNFNLAVSLDRLGQTGPAANYYRRAINTATGTQVFDIATAKTRLDKLSPVDGG